MTEDEKGYWIEISDYYCDTVYECSNCGTYWDTIEGTPVDNLWNYCPNCGKPMSKEIRRCTDDNDDT